MSEQSKYIALDFWEAIKICFNKYANFNERASRSEYWWFTLFTTLTNAISSFFDYLIQFDYYNSFLEYYSFGELGQFEIIHFLILLIPSVAVGFRRLHDVNRSAWNYLWAFTIIGAIPLIIWICTEGDDGKNKYGNNPLKKRKLNKVKVNNDKPKVVEESKGKKETSSTDVDQISDELKKYKQLLKDGLISQADYNAKKKKILDI